MNAYLRKEIRLLLPSFAFAMVAALSIWLIPPDSKQGQNHWMWLIIFPILVCPALVVMMALDSFGREMSCNTFANLLSQPISRSRIWWTKSSLLALALITIFGTWVLSLLMHLPGFFWANSNEMHDMFITAALLVVTVYSGGLWTVLLLRQVGAAFWFTLIAPAALATLTGYVTDRFGEASQVEHNIICVLVTYSVASFVWAWRLFLRAQDVQWTGGEIALPTWVKLPRMFVPPVKLAGRRPMLALLVKEFQLHQSQFIIAGFLAILHSAIIVARNAHGGLRQKWAWDFVAEYFWALWMLMPMLVGCAAVAEERKLGTLEGQLCLPARRRTQFIIKFGAGLGLAVFFGFIIPLLLEGKRILPDFNGLLSGRLFSQSPFTHEKVTTLVNLINTVLPFLPLFGIAIALFFVAFYASALSRNTLQAIGPSILGFIIIWALFLGAMNIESVVGYPLWRGGLIYLIGLPALLVTLVCLTYWNFKRVFVGWPVSRQNGIVLFTSLGLVMVLTTAIYQRSWELFGRFEPSHGASRIAGNEPVRVSRQGWRLSLLFPDGREWSSKLDFSKATLWQTVTGTWMLNNILHDGRFLEGSNWVNVVTSVGDIVGLKSDGSLWVSKNQKEPTKLVRHGKDADWKNLASCWGLPFVLKTNGTLWTIGTNNFWGKAWPGLCAFEPRQLGNDSDWAEILTLGSRNVFRKTDGRTYVYPNMTSSPKESITLEQGTVAERVPGYERRDWIAIANADNTWGSPVQIGLKSDGSLIVAGRYQAHKSSIEFVATNERIEGETNWVALDGNFGTIVSLKANGTLWLWDFFGFAHDEQSESPQPTQLGQSSTWRGIGSDVDGAIALSGDGSVWYWQLMNRENSRDFFPLFGPSRKPQLIGNIFSKLE